jgi:hypothetical protein
MERSNRGVGTTTIMRLEAGLKKQNSSPEGDDFVHVVINKMHIFRIRIKQILTFFQIHPEIPVFIEFQVIFW